MFNNISTKSAEEATEALFDKALSFVKIQDDKTIKQDYDGPLGFKAPWGSRELIKGSEKELRERVFSNLMNTSKSRGFYDFTVSLYGGGKCAQVISCAEGSNAGSCASVCLWKSENSLYLCGNINFI